MASRRISQKKNSRRASWQSASPSRLRQASSFDRSHCTLTAGSGFLPGPHLGFSGSFIFDLSPLYICRLRWRPSTHHLDLSCASSPRAQKKAGTHLDLVRVGGDAEDAGRGCRAALAGPPRLSTGGGGQVPAIRLLRLLHHRLRHLLHQQRSVEVSLRTQMQHQVWPG